MAVYAIGDIQGCFDELESLLEHISFDSTTDRLWFTGDLVNRGPKSLETLRFVKNLGDNAVTVLGNHDLHFLAVAAGHGKKLANDTLAPIFEAPDCDELVDWLRHQPLLHYDEALDYVMIHAGLPPQWDLTAAKVCALELEEVLQGPDYPEFIACMYGNQPNRWHSGLQGIHRLRFITNAFTRLRFCDRDGVMDFKEKGAPGTQADGLIPWYDVPGRKSESLRVVFGHWSTLGVGDKGNNVLALDGGCLWGGKLAAVRLDSDLAQWFEYNCAGNCTPGTSE